MSLLPLRKLGSTGLKVSSISFGCASLGNVFEPVTQEQAEQLVSESLASGINLFDTAPYYGSGLSETVLGRCLKGVPRSKYVLATKVGRYGKHDFDFSAARIEREFCLSLQRLGVDYVDVLQCHDIEFASSLQQVMDEALPTLYKLQQRGLCKAIGVTGLSLPVLDYALRNSSVALQTTISYCCYSLQNDSLRRYLNKWSNNKVAVIQAGSTSMGLLTNQGPRDWHPAGSQIKDLCAKAAQHCQAKGHNIAELAFKYTYQEQQLSSTLIGFTHISQLRQALDWVRGAPPDAELLREVHDILRPVHNQIWVEPGTENNIKFAQSKSL